MSKPMFQQIYIEITNLCNLHCPFCELDQRSKMVMDLDSFRSILRKVKPYTDSIYLHVKGEPLLHPDFGEIIALCTDEGVKVKITTNGTLLVQYEDLLLNSPIIQRINISLQSTLSMPKVLRDQYFTELEEFVSHNKKRHLYLRMWAIDDECRLELLNILKMHHLEESQYLHYSYEEEFKWPSLSDDVLPPSKCLGGKKQLAVLVDGTVTLCCLDHNGQTNLGNLLNDSLDAILQSEKYQNAVSKMPYLELCQKCSYRLRFQKGGMKSS